MTKRGRQKIKNISEVVCFGFRRWMDGVICDVKQYLPFSDTSQTSRRGTKVRSKGGTTWHEALRDVPVSYRQRESIHMYVKDHILSLTAETVVFLYMCNVVGEE